MGEYGRVMGGYGENWGICGDLGDMGCYGVTTRDYGVVIGRYGGVMGVMGGCGVGFGGLWVGYRGLWGDCGASEGVGGPIGAA